METRIEYRPPAGRPVSGALADIEFTTFITTEAFAGLEEEWDELYDSCPSATPFQSWAWLYSWWQAYGDLYLLRIVVLRRSEDGLAIGIAPLMLKRRRLLWVGAEEGNVLDLLAREGFEEEVCEACGRAIQQMRGWHTADLRNARSGSLVWGMGRGLSGPVIRVPQEGSPVMETVSWDETLSSLKAKRRSAARCSLRKLDSDGVRVERAQAREAKAAARRLIALHRESWQGRDIDAEHESQRWESYVEAAVRRLTERGLGSVSEFRLGEEVIMSHFLLHDEGYAGGFLGGATQQARKRYQITHALVRDGLHAAESSNAPRFDLMQGEDPHKLFWASDVEPVYRMVIGKNVPLWLPYAGYRLARVGVKRYLRAESTPQWVKDSYERIRELPCRSKDRLRRLTGQSRL